MRHQQLRHVRWPEFEKSLLSDAIITITARILLNH
ncbi:hypothetical protein F383_26627 [Gossypium arboreum]|uniref:Uncharacterized protein n=1 Tax=Gossypium arboreum TaxID=29729 RepID=A0A0B0MMA7_GOSAR|nr:hypothetical protein F383_26627 [Gossypium arboreum]